MRPPTAFSDRTRLGLTLLGLAVVLGVLGDQLLRVMPWGVNVVLCVAALTAAGAWLVRRHRLPASTEAAWLLLTTLLAAAAFVRRDSGALQALDLAAVAVALSLAALAAQGATIRGRGISAYALATASSAVYSWIGTPLVLFSDVQRDELSARGPWRQVGAIGLGAVIAIPLLLVFGGLFVSADAAFESLLTSLRLDLRNAAGHVFFTGLWGGLAAGYLRGACLGSAGVAAAGERLPSPNVRFATTATVLGALDLLFLLFVSLQARWLFGGAALVERTTGLTMAEYARRGFFELTTAAALVLPVLLVAEWATAREKREQETSFRALATLLVLLVGVLLASALQRMLLYVRAFGLTELRLYTTAFMVWLAGVFAWFVWTVLRRARARFAFGALVQALVVLAGLHVANPDAVIARVNLARVASGARFDAVYVARDLSADAVPVLLDALPRLGDPERREVARRLLVRWTGRARRDWRSWNWSEARARSLVRARATELTGILRASPKPSKD